jgi:hypothetical protein
MNIIRKLLAGAAILGMALAGAAAVTVTASASTVPVVYAADTNAWHASVEPGRFFFGQGGAPYLTQLHWTSWNGTSAWATGKLWIQQPGCTPSYKCPYYSRWAGIYLNTIRWHNGTRYYARMAARFYYGGKWHWDTGWIVNGYWIFPPVYPYL